VTSDWKPKPWLAALLNLWGGLGHLYAGRLLTALVIPPLLLLWLFALLMATCYVSTAGARVGIVVVFLVSRLMVVPMWGYLTARRTQPAPKRGFQRWYALAAYAIAATTLVVIVQRTVVPPWLNSYRVNIASMQPTLRPGDVVLTAPDGSEPHRHDVVLTSYGESGRLWFRRVIGMPGDHVELRDFHAYINGEAEYRRFGACEPRPDPSRADFGPIDVPAGQYALFSDCRDNWVDMRRFGFTARGDIITRRMWIVWSADANGPLFDRIGQTVR